jgi:hypothetical protein
MITNIPLCLARAILCDWLEDMKSIVNLDSAICGKGRNTWLDILNRFRGAEEVGYSAFDTCSDSQFTRMDFIQACESPGMWFSGAATDTYTNGKQRGTIGHTGVNSAVSTP